MDVLSELSVTSEIVELERLELTDRGELFIKGHLSKPLTTGTVVVTIMFGKIKLVNQSYALENFLALFKDAHAPIGPGDFELTKAFSPPAPRGDYTVQLVVHDSPATITGKFSLT